MPVTGNLAQGELPESSMIPFFTFLAAFLTAVILIPLAKRLAVHLGLVALPGGRRQHEGRIPKLGGLPLFFGYLAGILLICIVHPKVFPSKIKAKRSHTRRF